MRMLRQFIIVIVLGAITSILIAWAFATWQTVPMYAGTPAATLPRPYAGAFLRWGRPWMISEIRGFGFDDIWWLDLHCDSPNVDSRMLVETHIADRSQRAAGPRHAQVTFVDAPPVWGTFQQQLPPDERFLIGSDTAYGWPRPCMWYQVVGHISGDLTVGYSETGDFIHGAWWIGGQLDCVSHDYTAIHCGRSGSPC